MLPKIFNNWHPATYRPKSRFEERAQEQIKWYLNNGYSNEEIKDIIITEEEALNILEILGIDKNTAFYQFYIKFKSTCDEILELDEILEDYKNPFWADKYPVIQEKYLRISSIEGEGSYFYDKQTDELYDVDWKDMDDFMAGKLKPLFTSFYDFLEWYYSEEDEE